MLHYETANTAVRVGRERGRQIRGDSVISGGRFDSVLGRAHARRSLELEQLFLMECPLL